MSHFVASPCTIDGNSLVNKVAWSYVDPIAALATVVVDEKHRKVYKVQFMNSEVSFFVVCGVDVFRYSYLLCLSALFCLPRMPHCCFTAVITVFCRAV